MSIIQDIIANNRKSEANQQKGIYAICSAHPLVLEAAILQAKQDNSPLLIEATANQVNQFGGYSNMQPAGFYQRVFDMAKQQDFDSNQIILGGDHLGPVVWQKENAAQAYEKAKELIRQYVKAGFKKIHLDCSMPCADDPTPLPDEIIAERAADLCLIAEQTANAKDIVYVIGTEVPPPGGATETITQLEVTDINHARQTIALHQQAFAQRQLSEVWPRVIGLVVQPGVEFDNFNVIDYQSHKAQPLKQLISEQQYLAFEAHSTDYQHPLAYKQLVNDHFAILKVGPQLTYAMREALFALSKIEQALINSGQIAADKSAQLEQTIEQVMIAEPNYWQSFYQQAKTEQQTLYRQYSYADRIRYYWPKPAVKQAVEQLFDNLTNIAIPPPLISQYLPKQYQQIRAGQLQPKPKQLVIAQIQQVLAAYVTACQSK